MYYNDLLKKYKDVSMYQLVVAREVDCYREYEIDDDGHTDKLTALDFEMVCDYIYDYYMNTDGVEIAELVGAFFMAISNGEIKLTDIHDDPKKVDEAVFNNMF